MKLPGVAKKFAALAKARLDKVEIGKETALLSLPIGFYQNDGGYQPMMATFRLDCQGKFRLDFNSLGNNGVEGTLQDSYLFDAIPDEKKLTEICHSLSILSFKLKEASSVTPGYRERVRIKVMRQFDTGGKSSVQKDLKDYKAFDAEKWLHEKICRMNGEPMKSVVRESVDRTLKGIIGTDLGRFFEHVPVQEKISFLIELIEKHYDRYMKACPYLTLAQQERQLQLLKFKVKKLEDHLIKRMGEEDLKALKTVNGAFDLFFQKTSQMENSRKKIEEQRRMNKALEIDHAVAKFSGNYELAPNINVERFVEESKSPQSDDLLAEYKTKLDVLSEGVKNKEFAVVLGAIEDMQKETEKLIVNKSYGRAKALSTEILTRLPVPTAMGKDLFWDPKNFSAEKDKKGLMVQIDTLNKHIWESSLRLQETTAAPKQVVQMIKSQLIIHCLSFDQTAPLISHRIDTEEIKDLLIRHPHYRFGWMPERHSEVNQLLGYLKGIPYRNREDGDAGQSFDPNMQKETLSLLPNEDDLDTTTRKVSIRLQCMLTSLIKPDLTLYPHYAKGHVNAATGVTYLDSLVKEAVNRGAKTPKEKSELIKIIKYENVQRSLSSMKRLDIFTKELYVTGKPCLTIGSTSGSKLAYFSKDPWNGITQEYGKKYHFSNTQSNTKTLTGAFRGEENYLTVQDESQLYRSGLDNFGNFSGTLSNQYGETEPTLLKKNLQKDPKGLFSQMSNYSIESTQVTQIHDNKEELSYQSVFESLNLLRTEAHLLGEVEFQRSILLTISRPGFLLEAIKNNPDYFETLAEDMHRLIQKNHSSATAASFLLILGNILAKHMEGAEKLNRNSIHQKLIEAFPAFQTKIKLGKEEKRGYEWICNWMLDPEKEISSLSMAMVFANYGEQLDHLPAENLALLMHASKIFTDCGDSVKLPVFNMQLKEWIQQTLIPHLRSKIQGNEEFKNGFLNRWIQLATGNLTYSASDWIFADQNFCQNKEFNIHLNTLNLESKTSAYSFKGMQIDLPPQVARSLSSLFGTDQRIKCSLKKGKSVSENRYEFEINKRLYSILHNQETGKVAVYLQLPTDVSNPKSKLEWFQYVEQKAPEEKKLSAIENLIVKKGLWVSVTNPKRSYLYSSLPSEGVVENPYLVELNGRGIIQRVTDPVAGMVVLLDKQEWLCETVSFLKPNEAIFLKPARFSFWYPRATEVRFPRDGSSMKREGRGNWVYRN